MPLAEVLADLNKRIGEETHLSEWLPVTQELIDMFASATGDKQWIHVDEHRAKTESPYGTTIAHGYLTLSLYPLLRGLVDAEKPIFPNVKNIINYGLNKLRFTNAVKVGSKIRARCTLIAAEEIKNSLQLTEQYTVEIDGQDRPACVAECVMRLYF
ncbi:MAG TPA: MaoC family dehydratase [Gammaproteobacteria bacterium]|jgi:acyl dehydratase|nr:MaoC family dehydratase [Gammaproteobacteria bacterium]MDP7154611.1 MaoC family dehydratase [Gammaproteobacteria bacterium]MDP7296605.1 MaoC family dehydratase [Gammaproteobacteria bacterium]MDP7659607.1 MaoC family dehydratase [Gammaproteobacteria bacterium]HJP37673.1 MaoC family dehydratase [Gammaproteobacteria bacterium]